MMLMMMTAAKLAQTADDKKRLMSDNHSHSSWQKSKWDINADSNIMYPYMTFNIQIAYYIEINRDIVIWFV